MPIQRRTLALATEHLTWGFGLSTPGNESRLENPTWRQQQPHNSPYRTSADGFSAGFSSFSRWDSPDAGYFVFYAA